MSCSQQCPLERTRIKRVIIDLDNTLNSLGMHILHRLGVASGPFAYDEYPTFMGWDLYSAYIHMRPSGTRAPSEPEFWSSIPSDVWETAPPSAEMDFILKHASLLVGCDHVYVATTILPWNQGPTVEGKMRWIKEYLPSFMHSQVLFCSNTKRCFATRGTLLIDDASHNTDHFKGGDTGQSILVPRPWNKNRELHTQDHLEQQLSSLKKRQT